MKLVAAAPELLEVYRGGGITTDQMIALCATDDHEVQRTVWNTHGQHYWSNKPADLRRHVLAQDVQADRDYLVAFIGGVAPYEDAGGDVRRDLFSTDGQSAILTNPALLDVLVAEMLDGEADTLRAEGWGWVEDALLRSLLGHRNVAVQEVASQNVSAMKILQACWTVKELRTGYNDAPTNLLISSSGSGTRNGYPISDDAGVANADAFRKSCSDAVKDLPTADGKLWDELSEMKPAQLDRIIALGVALSISLNAEHNGLTAKLLETLGFDMAEHFKPTADNYLTRVPKLLVIEALTEAKRIDGTADTLLGMKKGVRAAEAEIRMAGSGWVPKGIRTPKAPTKGKTPSKAAALKSKAKVPAQAITIAAALA